MAGNNVSIEHTYAGRPAVCTLYATGASNQAIADDIKTAWATNIQPLLVADVKFEGVRVTEAGQSAFSPAGGGGGIASSGLAPNTALLVNKEAIAGRYGRMYIPGATEVDVNYQGLLDSPYLAAWQTALDGFVADMAASGTGIYVIHKDGSTNAITAMTMQAKVATQRRRLRK